MKILLSLFLTALGLGASVAHAENCDANYAYGTQAQSDCYLRNFRSADAKLNKTYLNARASLANESALRSALKVEEEQWIASKEIRCDRESRAGRSTIEKQILWRQCATDMTLDRRAVLQETYDVE